MIIQFSQKLMDKEGEGIFNTLDNSFWSTVVSYIIDSRNSLKRVTLSPWIREQVNNPSKELLAIVDNIPSSDDYDEQIMFILHFVVEHLKYTSDSNAWKATEYWANTTEIISTWKDDCDGGATLMYVIARLKGIPANRLLIMTGSVNGGGHCWLAYKPNLFPLNFVFIDWCYWVNLNSVDSRNKFSVTGKQIREYNGLTLKNSNYYSLWFAFNEDKSYSSLNYKNIGD